MVRDLRRYGWITAALLAACGSGDNSTPAPRPMADAMPEAASPDATPADTQTMDVQTMDVAPEAGPDAPADTSPARCTGNADCASSSAGSVCDTASGRCVQCVASADTCMPSQHCDPMTNTCVAGCRSDEGCATAAGDGGTAATRCDTAMHVCVACLTDEHCPIGNRCMGNVCSPGCTATRGCPTGQSCCDSACVDTTMNVAACGGCGRTCTVENGMPGCSMGSCTVAACAAMFADCDGMASNGCEARTDTVMNCGMCGNACPARANATPTCTSGACGFTCNTGFADCDRDPSNGCEVDTRTSAGNCGMCGNACTFANAGATCADGACVLGACNANFGNCDGMAANGCEADLRTTPSHCGMCGNACTFPNAAATCAGGACGLGTCNMGFGNCDGMAANGCEVNTASNASHCGMCGAECALAHAVTGCAMSVCVPEACETGFGNCDGMAANGCEEATTTSNAHCGACGNACGAMQVCVRSACSAPPSCAALLARAPGTPSGTYSLDPDGPGGAAPFAAYCDMTTAGGGWTLLLMAASSPTGTFGFDATAWTDDTVRNPTVTDPASNTDVKSPAFNSMPFASLRLCIGTVSSCVTEAVTSTSARALFAGAERLGTNTAATFAAVGLTGSFGCNRVAFNVYDIGAGSATASRARCRYGILLNNEATCEGSVDGGRGLGCRGYYGTQISAGQGDGIVSVAHQRGWIFAR